MGHVLHDSDAVDLLQSAQIALAYHYESDRARVLRDTWSVLRSTRETFKAWEEKKDERSLG
jgi:hypothetical protein